MSFILNFFGTLIGTVGGFIFTSIESIIRGLGFVLSMFTVIPNYLMNEFFPSMPYFFQDALYGLLGFMIFILVTKIIISIKG